MTGWRTYLQPAALAAASLIAAPTMAASEATTGNRIPARIITISPNAAEIICELGACDGIVGVDKFCVHPPQLLDKPKVGGLIDPDLEKIIALRPDLVVLRGQSEALERLCESLDIPLYRDRTDALSDVPGCIRALGALLGRKGNAAQLVQEFEASLEAVRQRVADRPRPRVFITYSRQPDSFANVLTAGKGTFLDDAIKLAGGRNVFGQLDMPYPQVSPEAILAARPDVVIELLPESKPSETLKEQVISAWRSLGPIPALEDGRIHIITDDHCLIPSPRYVDIVDKVSRLIHPEPDGEQPARTAVESDRHPVRVPDPP